MDEDKYYVLLHVSWRALCEGAEILNMRKRLKDEDKVSDAILCSCHVMR